MTRRFKSKPPKKGVKGFGDEIPGMDRLGTDITVVCPWETFIQLEVHKLTQYGIICNGGQEDVSPGLV
uniref:3',5'-cyclic-GMP phosphodiesterase n=1 Tax=Cyprinus carpio TaxID=7962 RepID=A0A8C2K0R9_CYPCA